MVQKKNQYDSETINSPNPLARLSHRNRKRIEGYFQDKFLEFIGAAFFGIPGYRENPDFDFRHLVRFCKSRGWKVKVLGYGPLPIPTWYGNSQVFLSLTKCQ